LGLWVETQRANYSIDLTAERRKRLNDLGLVVNTSSLREKQRWERWETMLERLGEYKAQHGDCLVPREYEQNPKLGRWVAVQRFKYQSLTAERRKRLNDLGFVVNTGSSRKEQRERWETMLDRLGEYKAQHGDCLVPREYKQNPKLGRWVAEQRTRYKSLTAERRKRLEDLGFVVDARNEQWDAM
jgi:Fe2+ transport system protein FeoA